VGLAVDHDAVPKMIEKYQALLDKMAASDMPESATYRSTLEKICRHRIQACLDHPDDPEKVEELCNCGQVEELVVQADNEMMVLDMYLDRRFWEQISDFVPHDINPDPTEDIYPDDHDENLIMTKPGDAKQGN
jgi:NADH dehydrogenase (ubiquinone) 1 alpha subcomplex subunit 5